MNDLTNGGIINKLVFIALPIIGTQFMQMAYTIIDMFWLGRLSEGAVAASGTAGMYIWLSAALMIFGQTGASIGVSQNIGRGDRNEAMRFAETALTMSMVLGIMFMAFIMLLKAPLIGFFQIQEASVDAMAQSYLLWVAPFVPLSYINAVITACYIAMGNSRAPFFVNGVGLCLNIVLDPIMIFTLGWGIEGAAAASVVAQGTELAVFIYITKLSKNKPFGHIRFLSLPSSGRIRQIFSWALPVSMESLLFTILSMMLTRIIATWGSGALAVIRIGSQLEALTWMIGVGFASAITVFTGQNYGALKWMRIHKGFKASLVMMSVWGLIVSAILFFGAKFLMGAFLDEPSTLAIGISYLRIASLCQILMCMECVSSGLFRGMGKTLPPSIASISMNTARLILAYFLAKTSLGLNGVWWAISLGAAARGVILILWYMLYSKKLPRVESGS